MNSGPETLAARYHRLTLRYRHQDLARHLMPRERVAQCLRSILPQVSTVEVWGDRARGVAHLRNLQLCGSVWMCPVCASNIAEKRRQQLEKAITTARAQGLVVALETLTARHYRDFALKPFLAALLDARRDYVRGRLSAVVRDVYGLVGRVTALEATYSLRHGWHPHFHSLLVFTDGADLENYRARMSSAWLAVLTRKGLDGNGHAYDLKPTYGSVADYVAKWGHEPASPPWGVAAELTKWHVKGGRAFASSMTPFQLLQASEIVPAAGALFQEFAGAFKGRHQLQWSRGLFDELVGEPDVSDDEAAKGEADEQRAMLALLLAQEWQVVRANSARAELLRAALAGDDDLREFMQALGLRL